MTDSERVAAQYLRAQRTAHNLAEREKFYRGLWLALLAVLVTVLAIWNFA